MQQYLPTIVILVVLAVLGVVAPAHAQQPGPPPAPIAPGTDQATLANKVRTINNLCAFRIGSASSGTNDQYMVCSQKWAEVQSEYDRAWNEYLAMLRSWYNKDKTDGTFTTDREVLEDNMWAAVRERFKDSCYRYKKTNPIPTGFGSPYLVAGDNSPVLSFQCDRVTGDVHVTAGEPNNGTVVFEKGYWYDTKENRWKEFSFDSVYADKTGVWYRNQAFATIDMDDEPGNEHAATWVVTYTCTPIDGVWKCGCRDRECSTPSWQIQQISRLVLPPPPPRP
jgi:hypothetical protein